MRCQCLLWSCRTAYSNLIDPDLRQSSSMRGVSGMLPPSLPLFHFVKLIRHSLKTPDLLLFHHTVGLTTALYLPCMLSSLSSLQHASNCHVSYSSKVNPHDLTAQNLHTARTCVIAKLRVRRELLRSRGPALCLCKGIEKPDIG